jgi:hypothetical protein
VLTHDKDAMVSAPMRGVVLNVEKTRFGAVGTRVPLILNGATGVIGERMSSGQVDEMIEARKRRA